MSVFECGWVTIAEHSNEEYCLVHLTNRIVFDFICVLPWFHTLHEAVEEKEKEQNKYIYVFQVKICMRDMYVWYGCCWLWHSYQMHVRACRLADGLASERTRYIYRYIVRCKTATMYYHRVNQLNADSGIFLCFVILMLVPLHTASNFDPRQF